MRRNRVDLRVKKSKCRYLEGTSAPGSQAGRGWGGAGSWWRKETRDASASLCRGEVTIHTEAALPWSRRPGEVCLPQGPNL